MHPLMSAASESWLGLGYAGDTALQRAPRYAASGLRFAGLSGDARKTPSPPGSALTLDRSRPCGLGPPRSSVLLWPGDRRVLRLELYSYQPLSSDCANEGYTLFSARCADCAGVFPQLLLLPDREEQGDLPSAFFSQHL